MLKDVVRVQLLGGYRLQVEFEDGLSGEIDVAQLVPFEGVFAELRDPNRFAEARVDAELGCISWPGGADLDPDVIYMQLSTETQRVTQRHKRS